MHVIDEIVEAHEAQMKAQLTALLEQIKGTKHCENLEVMYCNRCTREAYEKTLEFLSKHLGQEKA